MGLRGGRHKGDQRVSNGFLHRVLRPSIEDQAIDDRADDYAPRHELADDLGHVGVVAAEPIDPADDQGVARPQQLE